MCYIYLFISLILIVAEAEDNENESEEQCGEHTYKAVRPLLKYIHQMKEEIENNNNKVEGKDREIKHLQEELNQNNKQVIEELRAQNEFYKQSIKELTSNVLSIKEEIGKLISKSLRIQDYEEQLKKQKKSIDQQAQQISKLKNEINLCEKKRKSCEEKPVYGECADFADAPGIHKINPDQEASFDVLCDSATVQVLAGQLSSSETTARRISAGIGPHTVKALVPLTVTSSSVWRGLYNNLSFYN